MIEVPDHRYREWLEERSHSVQRSYVNQHAQWSMLPDKSLEFQHEALVAGFHRFPADLNDRSGWRKLSGPPSWFRSA